MEKQELGAIAQVMHRKIYSENIRIYTQLAYEGQEYYSHALEEKRITISDIEQAITFHEDLNQIHDLSIQNYLTTDLNAFLLKILAVRENTVQSYTDIITKEPTDLFICGLESILECFTEEESLPIKKAFLKRTLNGYDVEAMEQDAIDCLFWNLFIELRKQIEQEITRKLVQ